LLGYKAQKRLAAHCAANLFWALLGGEVTVLLQPIETLKGKNKSLKVPLRGTFRDLFGFK